MSVRRYFSPTMRGALEQVRQAQGDDVFILSNRNVDGGIELITTLEPPSARPSVSAKTAPLAATPTEDSDTLGLMRRELGAMKSLLEHQLASFAWQDYQERHPLRARLMRALARLGIVPHVARSLVASIAETTDFDAAWLHVLHAMEQRLICSSDPIAESGVYALCGATGVGKTSIACKLASAHALAHGADRVTVISADEQRLGAHQQLKTFGRLVGIRVEAARSAADLAEQIEAHSDQSLVLIDLPGYAPHHPNLGQHLADLKALPHGVRFLLAAAATTDYLAQMRMARALATLPLAACCLTKLDETAALGPAFSMLIETGLPLAYVSVGPQVPDDLERVTGVEFLRRMLAFGRENPTPLQSNRFEEAFAL
jgi:flagellar biosynthesis protein FlhF